MFPPPPPSRMQFIIVTKTQITFLYTGVLEEAEFYNVTELIKLTKEKIFLRDTITLPKEKKKRVFRVLQIHEDELAPMISTLSDGWQFEQVHN